MLVLGGFVGFVQYGAVAFRFGVIWRVDIIHFVVVLGVVGCLLGGFWQSWWVHRR